MLKFCRQLFFPYQDATGQRKFFATACVIIAFVAPIDRRLLNYFVAVCHSPSTHLVYSAYEDCTLWRELPISGEASVKEMEKAFPEKKS